MLCYCILFEYDDIGCEGCDICCVVGDDYCWVGEVVEVVGELGVYFVVDFYVESGYGFVE